MGSCVGSLAFASHSHDDETRDSVVMKMAVCEAALVYCGAESNLAQVWRLVAKDMGETLRMARAAG